MTPRILLAASLLLALPLAHAQQKHVHGEGRLDAALEKETLTLNLELPLDAAAGFERAPKNDKEKAALATTLKTLKDSALFQPNAAAQCTVQSVQVSMPKFEGEHADIDANYVFRCTAPAELKGIETTLFKRFKRLYRIETQRIGPTGQGAQRLTSNKPVLRW